MEQILAFVLGVSAVTFVWIVAVAYRTVKQVKNIETNIASILDFSERKDVYVQQRFDQEVERVNSIFQDCIRHTDSRVDKLESKILSLDKDGCEPTKKLLKG